MKKVLVTGGNGQLGSEIRALALQFPSFHFHFTDHEELDITDQKAVTHFFKKDKWDILINCAAHTAVDKAETEQERAFAINARAAETLALAAKSHQCQFVHISTDFVFDGTKSFPYDEGDSTNPLSVYGASKAEGERLVQQANDAAMIIRTSWVYSSFGTNFVKTIMRLCRERDTLQVIADQVGTPTYARDLAFAILSILEKEASAAGVYHFSNEGVASWYDFAIAIRDFSGLKTTIAPISTTQYPTPAIRPKYSVLNKQKIKLRFGITIPYWRESLKECIDQIIAQHA
ncbi:MAG: dTDP-4-dehydrorhamnose reductase [Chitinophagales bacterium]